MIKDLGYDILHMKLQITNVDCSTYILVEIFVQNISVTYYIFKVNILIVSKQQNILLCMLNFAAFLFILP